jgi:hypothetical protein
LLEHVRADRFLPFLALLHFIRGLTRDSNFEGPPPRASIVMDDPNLHRPRYGYLDFAEVAGDAERHDYHVAMAMVPLDGWMSARSAVRIFKDHAARLSILMHGNNHSRGELGRPESEAVMLGNLVQGLRRIEAFESRSGLEVSRVMTPPHGVCSQEAARGMFRLGFDALCMSRPYPWLTRPPSDRPLAGWFPAELIVGGFPIIPRYALSWSKDEILLRAFLDQPIVLSGHHTDAAGGLGPLQEWARFINGLGEFEWLPLGEIARTNYGCRREGGRMIIRPYARRVRVRIPPEVEEIAVRFHPAFPDPAPEALMCRSPGEDGPSPAASADVIDARGKKELELTFQHPEPVDPHAVSSPGAQPWPIVRRLLTEGRDRLLPMFSPRSSAEA